MLTIYYAGNNGLRVLTDTEAVVGIPITALVPEIGLAMTHRSITVSVITKEELIRKNTFDNRVLTEEPKFVQKRRNKDICDTVSTNEKGNE